MKLLFRTFVAQFFTSETVTSDVQMRQAMIWVLAFILTPCLLLLINVFPQFQYLVIRVGRIHPPPGVITRATFVRNLMAEDMLEWAVAMLVGYSAVTVGLVTVFVWDTLAFDRRDAMVLGPLPLRNSTMIMAKLAALAALLLGSSMAVNTLNALVFAIETSDQLGFGALVGHFVGCLVVTTAAATVVFAVLVTMRAGLAAAGSARAASALGTLLQFLFVLALLGFFIALAGSPARVGRFGVPDLGTHMTPLSWFVAWFEVLRRSDRGSWPEFVAMGRHATTALALSVAAAALTSVLAFRRQMQAALTPSATTGPLGRARALRLLARALNGRDRLATAVSDFVLITIVRNSAQQAPIAMNAAVGLALIVLGLPREHVAFATMLRAAPLMLAFWVCIGLRASFFIPSELPAAWMFRSHAPERYASYLRGVRAAIVALVAPAAGAAAAAVGGWTYGVAVVLLVVALADAIVVTVDFLPFTRAYLPGHAKLKTRWPLYAIAAYAFAYGLPHAPLWSLAAAVVVLELIGVRRSRSWTLEPNDDAEDEPGAVIRLDLLGANGV